jgi:MoaA/NifB/PqqE/SkfB family radical SAM enzyme
MDIIERIKDSFKPLQPLEAGVYHYQSPADSPLKYKLHLRLEADGSGILLVNASTVLHLNQSAAEYAYYFIKNTPPEEAAKLISERFRISRAAAMRDYIQLREQIENLISMPDLDPVTHFGFEKHDPHQTSISAPYRLDCALTYRLPPDTPREAAPNKLVDRELTTDEWETIIDKAWNAGIPHILFTGGEPTLRDDLVELIQHAENNGQVTGLVTDGLKLGDTKYLSALLQAGLDHTMIILQPDKEKTWESLTSFAYWTETLKEDIFVAAHLTMTKENSKGFLRAIDKLSEAGVSAISLSTSDKSLSKELQAASDYAANHGIELVWDIPVPYSKANPVSLELETLGEEMPQTDYRNQLYVEPDGDVLPVQGVNQILGNMLVDDWEKIWGASKNSNLKMA